MANVDDRDDVRPNTRKKKVTSGKKTPPGKKTAAKKTVARKAVAKKKTISKKAGTKETIVTKQRATTPTAGPSISAPAPAPEPTAVPTPKPPPSEPVSQKPAQEPPPAPASTAAAKENAGQGTVEDREQPMQTETEKMDSVPESSTPEPENDTRGTPPPTASDTTSMPEKPDDDSRARIGLFWAGSLIVVIAVIFLWFEEPRRDEKGRALPPRGDAPNELTTPSKAVEKPSSPEGSDAPGPPAAPRTPPPEPSALPAPPTPEGTQKGHRTTDNLAETGTTATKDTRSGPTDGASPVIPEPQEGNQARPEATRESSLGEKPAAETAEPATGTTAGKGQTKHEAPTMGAPRVEYPQQPVHPFHYPGPGLHYPPPHSYYGQPPYDRYDQSNR